MLLTGFFLSYSLRHKTRASVRVCDSLVEADVLKHLMSTVCGSLSRKCCFIRRVQIHLIGVVVNENIGGFFFFPQEQSNTLFMGFFFFFFRLSRRILPVLHFQ